MAILPCEPGLAGFPSLHPICNHPTNLHHFLLRLEKVQRWRKRIGGESTFNNTVSVHYLRILTDEKNRSAEVDDIPPRRLFLSPVCTTRVDGLSWRVTGFHYPSTRPVNSASGNTLLSTRPVLTGNGNQSPVSSLRLTRAVNSSSGNRALKLTLKQKGWRIDLLTSHTFIFECLNIVACKL